MVFKKIASQNVCHLAVVMPTKHFNAVYRVGGSRGWSDLFWFKSLPDPEKTDWSPRLAVYGDLGNENAQSLPRLQRETQSGFYDMILHVGDFAYDLNTVTA